MTISFPMINHMTLFVGWCAIACGTGIDDEDSTVLLQTQNAQERKRHSTGNFVYDSDGANTPNYDEVWELPDADRCSPGADRGKSRPLIPGCTYKTEAEVQAACNANLDCRGYYAAGYPGTYSSEIIDYVLLVHKRWDFYGLGPLHAYGLGAPHADVLHVFAKDAASDLAKLGVSKAKYDYTEGVCQKCAEFGKKYLTEEDAQAACNFVGANCVGYWKVANCVHYFTGEPCTCNHEFTVRRLTYGSFQQAICYDQNAHAGGYFLLGFVKKEGEVLGFSRVRVESVMLKGLVPVIEPAKAGATPAAKKAAKKAARAEKLAAVAAKKAAKKAAEKRSCYNRRGNPNYRWSKYRNKFTTTWCKKFGYI